MDRQQIPPEARQMIEAFNAAEAARMQAGSKKENPKGRNIFESKVIKPGDAISLARAWGINIESAHGKHGIHLVSPDGTNRCSLPYHGEGQDLSKGVTKVVLGFIKKYGNPENK